MQTHCAEGRQHWPSAVCSSNSYIYYHQMRGTEKQKLFLLVAQAPLCSAQRHLQQAGRHSAACLAPTCPPGSHRSHISFLPSSPKKINSFPEAIDLCCVSAKASLSTLPDLQMRQASPRSWKKSRAKHHYWPSHHGEAEIVPLVFGRLLVLKRERERDGCVNTIHAPLPTSSPPIPRESNGGW